MKTQILVLLLAAGTAWSQTLRESEEMTLDAPWTGAVELEAPAARPYRLEATDLGGAPVEAALERNQAGIWVRAATNRQTNGVLSGAIEWMGTGDRWRIRPAKPETRTVVLRLTSPAFAGLRDSLKLTLTPGPEVSLPLRKRLELPTGSTGRDLQAAGVPFQEPSDGSSGRLEAPWGSFRFDTEPVPRVWKTSSVGWVDLELPRNSGLDRMLLGSTQDGLYALLASTRGTQRAFYLWRPGEGWTALDPPRASEPATILTATSGSGSLFLLERQADTLILGSYDGQNWNPPLDLTPLAPEGARSAVLLPPSGWSKTGTLVLTTDRVTVYDLP